MAGVGINGNCLSCGRPVSTTAGCPHCIGGNAAIAFGETPLEFLLRHLRNGATIKATNPPDVQLDVDKVCGLTVIYPTHAERGLKEGEGT